MNKINEIISLKTYDEKLYNKKIAERVWWGLLLKEDLSPDKARVFLLERYKVIKHIKDFVETILDDIIDTELAEKLNWDEDDPEIPDNFKEGGWDACSPEEVEQMDAWVKQEEDYVLNNWDVILSYYNDYHNVENYFIYYKLYYSQYVNDFPDYDNVFVGDLHSEEILFIIYLSLGSFLNKKIIPYFCLTDEDFKNKAKDNAKTYYTNNIDKRKEKYETNKEFLQAKRRYRYWLKKDDLEGFKTKYPEDFESFFNN
jgi:hypothetical protein